MRNRFIILLLCWPLLNAPAWALGILDIYALAQQKDPAFLAARQEKIAGEENQAIGRSSLLPQLSLSYQNGIRNWQTSKTPYNTVHGMRMVKNHRQYQSKSGALMLTQPIFDYNAWARYQTGKAQSLMSEANWRAKSMDLAVRVVNNYLDVMLAQEQVALLLEQQATWRQQLRQNQQMLRSGEGTVTEIAETESRLSLSEAEWITAQDDLNKARHALESMIGQQIESLSQLNPLARQRFKPLKLIPAHFKQWQEIALKNNAELAAARQQLQVNHYQTEQQRAGFFPDVQIYASQNLNHSSSETTINQRYDTTSIGIRVNYSLYSGGYNSATVRQASALYNKSKYDLEKTTNAILNELNTLFSQCSNAERRLNAYRQALHSAELQVKAVQQGVIAGQRTNVDLLNSRQQLFRARLELTTEQYRYLRAWLMLLYRSGQLTSEKIIEIASYFPA
jgi:protease secretion system outer membrane protein